MFSKIKIDLFKLRIENELIFKSEKTIGKSQFNLNNAKRKVEYEIEDIQISTSKKEDLPEEDPVKKGKVNFFDSSKGFGFIIDSTSGEKYFTHVSGLINTISENDNVSFELEKGMRGMNAVKVKKI